MSSPGSAVRGGRVLSSGLVARGAGAIAAAIGLGGLVGWWLGIPVLRSGFGSGAAINPMTAVIFLLGGLSIWISSTASRAPALRRIGIGCTAGVVLIAGLKLGELLFGLPLAVDQALFRERLALLQTDRPSPLTTGSAVMYLMLGIALVTARSRREAWRLLCRSIGLLLALVGVLVLLTYFYRRAATTGSSGSAGSGLGILLGFTALSVGVTAAGTRRRDSSPEDSESHALRRRVNLAFIVAAAILIITSGVSIWSTIRSRIADQRQAASSGRRDQIAAILAALQSAEVGQDGFLLTGNRQRLIRYRAALDSIPVLFERAARKLSPSAAQAGRLAALDTLARAEIALFAETLRLQESGESGRAVGLARSGRPRQVADSIRGLIATMAGEEDSLIARWKARLQSDDRISLLTNVIAGLLAVFFVTLAGLAINRDFKKRARAEAALLESEGRLSQIIELVPSMLFLKEPGELRFVRVNRAGEELLGHSRDEVLGKNAFDLFPDEEAQRFTAEDRAVLASGEVLDIPEERVQVRDKGMRILHTKKVAVRDDGGRPLYLLGISQDITERKQLEAERDRFFTLSLDMLCIATSDGYFKRLNPAFTQTLGWSIEELLARPFLDFVHPDDRAATLREVERQTVTGEEVLHFENRYQHKDGSWRTLSWKSVADPGGFLYATARDVTELREAEAAMRQSTEAADAANRAKSDFLAKMSHELRTPLNSIIGFSEILEDESIGPLTEKQRRYVGNVLVSGRNLLQLINDILDLSKVEAGRMELARSEFDVGATLQQIHGIVIALADQKQLVVQVNVGETLPLISADQAKFKQIMFNLLGNAIKFTPHGGRVEVSARRVRGAERGAAEWLEVAVADTGIGIPVEDQERIFGEFEQSNQGSGRSQQGTGLGLALTRKLVELHGGRVWLESEVGKGSTFRFTLPYLAVSPQAVTPTDGQAGDSGPKPEAPLVLVIDNDPGARDLISHYLEEHGYRAECAASGEEGIRLAETLHPTAITLDILLPDRDGLLILAQLKSQPNTRDIPVVVVSVTDRRDLGFSLGAADWLVKPVEWNALIAALERTTGRAPSGRARRVLVIDDEPAAIEYLTELLELRDYAVLAASGGRAGIDLALSRHPDLIILDLVMPELNGFDVVRALREDPVARHIPILILTASDLTAAETQRLKSSVQGLVAKGGPETLLAELSRLCPLGAGSAAAAAGRNPAG